MAVAFLTLLLVAAVSVHAQDLDRLQATFLRYKATQDDPDSVAEVKVALAQLDNMWTDYLPSLLESDVSEISEACVESALAIYSAGGTVINNITLPGPGVLPLLDATGRQGAGLYSGNVIQYGAYDECLSLDYSSYCLADRIDPTFKSPLPFSWTVGFCVPRGCTAQDLTLLINNTGLFLTEEAAVHCSDTKKPSYGANAIVMLVVCAVFIALVVIGTLIDTLVTELPKIFKMTKVEVSGSTSVNSDGELENSPLLLRKGVNSVAKRAEFETCHKKDKFNPIEFITAFSLLRTVPTLLATKQAPGVITSLNGIRVISMFWVILGHTYFWIFSNLSIRIDNIIHMLSIASRFSFQAVTSAFFAVDSFFFLSGVLVAYLTLRQMKKAKGGIRFPFLKYYLHRILRLTPTYAFVLFFAWCLTDYLSYGPEISLRGQPYAATCEKYWWTNLLYINNLYPWSLADECVGWTWYLSNDMQFYVIAPLFLIPAYFIFPIGLLVAFGLVLGGAIITGALSIVYDFQANTFSLLAYGYVGKGTETMSYSNTIYIKPWDRIAPYVVGLVLGYLIFKDIKLNRLNKYLRLLLYILMWVVALFVMFWLTYGLYFTWHGHVPKTFENFVYIVTSRFLWAVCLALIVFACHNGYGWVINSFLSMPMWTPLARMTFNAYLVHPIIMTVVYGQLQTTIHYTDITMAGFVVMFVAFSYSAAAAVCVVVEFPLSTIEANLFKLVGSLGKTKHPSNQRYVNLPKGEEKA
jgi:peptidoglycan/LPS O-acetylase OafA/YrhL